MKNSVPTTGKILFLQHDSIFETYGGVQYYIDDFLVFLSNLYGPEHVQVLLAQRTDHFKLEPRPYSIETVKLLQGPFKKIENRMSPQLFFRAFKLFRKQKISVIIASHLSLAPMAFILSKISGAPFLVIAYGFEVWGKFHPQDKWALKKADGIVSISYWTKSILEKQGFESKKISVVHPSVTTEMSRAASTANPLSESHIGSSNLRLLTIARLDSNEQYKGHDHVLQALKLIKNREPSVNVKYTIQGTGDDLPRLRQLVHDYGLSEIVSFLPAVKARDELTEIYHNHDIFIMPSRFGFWNNQWRGEGFGIVYVEAALFGLPSIAYSCGGVTDIIENHKNGLLVEPDNVEALADAIIELARNKNRLKELGETAREMAFQNFTRNSIEQQMNKAFKSYPFWKLKPALS